MLCWTQRLHSELNGNWDMQTLMFIYTTINDAIVQSFYSEHLKSTNPYVHSCDAKRNFYSKIIVGDWHLQAHMFIHATLSAIMSVSL